MANDRGQADCCSAVFVAVGGFGVWHAVTDRKRGWCLPQKSLRDDAEAKSGTPGGDAAGDFSRFCGKGLVCIARHRYYNQRPRGFWFRNRTRGVTRPYQLGWPRRWGCR